MNKVLFFSLVIFWFSCEPRQGQQVVEAPPKTSALQEVIAREVLQANSYTYVKGADKGKEVWLALPKREVEIGKTYFYNPEMEMKNFKSKDLDRTFESVYFINGLFDNPDGAAKLSGKMPDDEFHTKKEESQKQELNIQKEEGITTISDLYDNKEKLNSKKVTVKGVVTKYNPGIMDRNWVHIQDGTGGENTFDLTITTQDMTNEGSVVSFEGTVAINKDFGHGYKYELILEEATLLNQKPDVKVN